MCIKHVFPPQSERFFPSMGGTCWFWRCWSTSLSSTSARRGPARAHPHKQNKVSISAYQYLLLYLVQICIMPIQSKHNVILNYLRKKYYYYYYYYYYYIKCVCLSRNICTDTFDFCATRNACTIVSKLSFTEKRKTINCWIIKSIKSIVSVTTLDKLKLDSSGIFCDTLVILSERCCARGEKTTGHGSSSEKDARGARCQSGHLQRETERGAVVKYKWLTDIRLSHHDVKPELNVDVYFVNSKKKRRGGRK